VLLHGLRELLRMNLHGRHRAPGAIVVAGTRAAERDVVPVLQLALTVDALAVHVRAVQTSEIAQHEVGTTPLEDAVLLRDDLVQQLDRVTRMPAKRVEVAQVHDLLAVG
jgi:hypothetical protein